MTSLRILNKAAFIAALLPFIVLLWLHYFMPDSYRALTVAFALSFVNGLILFMTSMIIRYFKKDLLHPLCNKLTSWDIAGFMAIPTLIAIFPVVGALLMNWMYLAILFILAIVAMTLLSLLNGFIEIIIEYNVLKRY